jgi:hypothetical protein
MKTLIHRLIVRAIAGIVLVTGFTYAVFLAVNHFIQAIHESFYLSAAFISAAPALTFMAAFGYHYWVVGPIKQICALDTRHLSDIHKALVESAQEVIGFSRIIPIVFSMLALVLAVLVAPGILIASGIEPGNTVQNIFVSIVIAGQALLAMRIIRQIVYAIRYIREAS